MKCPVCGAAELVHDTRDLTYTCEGETTLILAVTGDFCPVCAESVLDGVESDRVMREIRAFTNQNKIKDISRDIPLTVFIAEPIAERLITNPRDDDTPDELAKRQAYLDLILRTGAS